MSFKGFFVVVIKTGNTFAAPYSVNAFPLAVEGVCITDFMGDKFKADTVRC